MRIGRVSVEQPVLAIVLAIVVIIVGALAYFTLGITEYPEIAPPTVMITTTYPGASAATVADVVAAPIEQEVNGVEDMLYMYSQATSDGTLNVTVTFRPGTDLDKAQVLVQNRVALAIPKLPIEVQRNGISVRKSSSAMLCVVFLRSPDATYDQLYISNFGIRRVADVLKRIDGIGDLQYFGSREYSMRIWLDPERLSAFNMTPSDVIAALRSENTQLASGTVAAAPVAGQAFQPSLIFQGRLKDVSEFGDIIVKEGADGQILRLRDVARIEVGALNYSTASSLLRKPGVAMLLMARPGANAIATTQKIKDTMADLSKQFPKGLTYALAYNPTQFIADSVSELVRTIYEAIVLVVIVVVIFLQGWRPSIIPILAIPVSLVGTFAAMAALGFSINYVTLFGLVLAVGIVVDDAIVVVENAERHLSEGRTAREAALMTMDEVGSALVSIALVLCAVFVPTAFMSGISGQFYREFGITIAVATVFSLFASLTLSPALSSMILKPHGRQHGDSVLDSHGTGWLKRQQDGFNNGFARLSDGYARFIRRAIAHTRPMFILYGVLIIGAAALMITTPKGFIPAQDRGYVIVLVNLPGGASIDRTVAVVKQVENIALGTPGVSHVPAFAGFSGATLTNATNTATLFPVFKDPSQRKGWNATRIADELRKRLLAVPGAAIMVIPPPPVQGIGNTGGFAMRLEDRAGLGTAALAKATNDLVANANATPGMVGVYTTFSAATPQIGVDLDRVRAQMLGVPSANVNEAIETYFGSTYVNDFNILGRTYHVTAQADLPFRQTPQDLGRVKVRNRAGDMVPLGSLVRQHDQLGVDRFPRYNLYPASEVNGDVQPGKGTGFAIATMTALAEKTLPAGISYDWTDLSYQQVQGGNTGVFVFGLCVVFVYLVLAAKYGSWSLPLAVILIVPMCLLAATLGVRLSGHDINIMTQIGFLVLVALAAKNAILIVEFARQLEGEGLDRTEAVIAACRLRLRPILMTSFAFILGVFPLVVTGGAGSEMRGAVGIPVFFGMLGVTFFGLIFTPLFYVAIRKLVTHRRQTVPDAPPLIQVPA
jgi:hydrophobe/amphiphile efflux-1 (HAE1) family protein